MSKMERVLNDMDSKMIDRFFEKYVKDRGVQHTDISFMSMLDIYYKVYGREQFGEVEYWEERKERWFKHVESKHQDEHKEWVEDELKKYNLWLEYNAEHNSNYRVITWYHCIFDTMGFDTLEEAEAYIKELGERECQSFSVGGNWRFMVECIINKNNIIVSTNPDWSYEKHVIPTEQKIRSGVGDIYPFGTYKGMNWVPLIYMVEKQIKVDKLKEEGGEEDFYELKEEND